MRWCSYCSFFAKTWLQWRERYTAACCQKENTSKALLHFSLKLKRKVLHQWMNYVSCCQTERKSQGSFNDLPGIHTMNVHPFQSFVPTFFFFIISFLISLDAVQRACCLHLVRVCWGVWRNALHHRWSEEHRLQAAGQLATRSIQRRALEKWKACILIRPWNQYTFHSHASFSIISSHCMIVSNYHSIIISNYH